MGRSNAATKAWETRRRRAGAPVQIIENVQARIYEAGGMHIGDLASWNASGVDVARETVEAAFATEGFAHHAPTIEPATALTRASHCVPKASGIDVRAFAKPNPDSPLSLGFYVLRAGDGESGDGWVCGARARITAQGVAVALPPEGGAAIPEALTWAEETARKANHILTHAQTIDISSALIGAMKELQGIPLRERGGFYLIPVASCARWRRLMTHVEPLGIEPITIEMHDAPSNLKAAAGAAKGSLETEIASLKEDLETANGEGMKKYSLDRRIRACDELCAKAELYRNVLKDAATGLEERIAQLRAGFAAQLAASEDDSLFVIPVTEETPAA